MRKLTGKPAFLTIADCESETRRIQYQAASSLSRIHSDLLLELFAIAAFMVLASSGDTLACISTPRTLVFGSFGLPIFGFVFIKYFVYYENNC